MLNNSIGPTDRDIRLMSNPADSGIHTDFMQQMKPKPGEVAPVVDEVGGWSPQASAMERFAQLVNAQTPDASEVVETADEVALAETDDAVVESDDLVDLGSTDDVEVEATTNFVDPFSETPVGMQNNGSHVQFVPSAIHSERDADLLATMTGTVDETDATDGGGSIEELFPNLVNPDNVEIVPTGGTVDAVENSGVAPTGPIYPNIGTLYTGGAGGAIRATQLQDIIQQVIGAKSSIGLQDFVNLGLSTTGAAAIVNTQGGEVQLRDLMDQFARLEGLEHLIPDSSIDAGLLGLMGPDGPTGNFFAFTEDDVLGADQFVNIVNEALTMAGRAEPRARVLRLFNELAGNGGFGGTPVVDGERALAVWPDIFDAEGNFNLATLADRVAVQFDNLPVTTPAPPVQTTPQRPLTMQPYIPDVTHRPTGVLADILSNPPPAAPSNGHARFDQFKNWADSSYRSAGFTTANIGTLGQAYTNISGVDGDSRNYSHNDHLSVFGFNPAPLDVVRGIQAYGGASMTLPTSGWRMPSPSSPFFF